MQYSNKTITISPSHPESRKGKPPRQIEERGGLLLRRETVHVVRIKTGMRTGALASWSSQAPGTSHIGTIIPPVDG